jgi:hypothetical protein
MQRPEYGVSDMYMLHDNARPHDNPNVHNFLESKGLKEFDNPPYSPGLALFDFWLFNYIK